jgi:formylglycine-generating enzyme required for sulfatase activity
MSSLADLPELVGFFSYARSEDEHSGGALSLLRKRIRGELAAQLARDDLRLWQDTEAIPLGMLWKERIEKAIVESAFFIPMVTPRAIKSEHCRTELQAFLERESELRRNDLVFPILYISVPGLENKDEGYPDDVLKIIHARQYDDWRDIRHADVTSPEVGRKITRFCEHIAKAVRKTSESPEGRRRRNDERDDGEHPRHKDQPPQAGRRVAIAHRRPYGGAVPDVAGTYYEDDAREVLKAIDAAELRSDITQHEFLHEVTLRRIYEETKGDERAHHLSNAQANFEQLKRSIYESRGLQPGANITPHFEDRPTALEMVVILPGKFMMGSPEGEGYNHEHPQHKIIIASPFAVGRFPVTFDEWDAAVAAGGVKHTPDDSGWGRGRRPVINVSWEDAQAYVGWLSSRLPGKTYRLLSEAEWEYCCRAGTTTAYSVGDTIGKKHAQFSESKTVEVASFPSNPWGLHGMHGNVWEWCKDSWHPTYNGACKDGSTWKGGDAFLRVRRGGSWGDDPRNLRSAARGSGRPDCRGNDTGFRVARTL